MEQNEITEKIIGSAYQVANTLGSGFVEKVYENSLFHDLIKLNLRVVQQHPINVYYDHILVGEFFADLVVENQVLLELKAVRQLEEVHTALEMNCLKASGLPICLLINFGRPKIEIRRFVPYDVWK
jgi:GxxExxY protein